MIADTVMKNGKIYTMDKEMNIVDAMAFYEDRIVFVGSNKDAEKYVSEKTQVMDLKGKVVLPGFIDTHVHVPGNAYNVLHNMDLYDARTVEEMEKAIGIFIKEHPEKSMYYGKGFKTSLFSGAESIKGPKKERLDNICSDKPIGIIDEGGHIIWLNTKALELAGITEKTEDIPGGCIERDDDTGEIWGTLKDEAKKLFPEQQFTYEEKIEAYRWFQDLFNSYGYTAVLAMRQSASSDPVPVCDVMKHFADENGLTLRLACAREIKVNEDADYQIMDLENLRNKYHNDKGDIRVTTAKFFLDGTVEGVNAYLNEPYEACVGKGEGYRGEPLWDTVRLENTFVKVMKKGFNIHIHAVGDGAVSQAVKALDEAQKCVPGDYRNCITHLQLADGEDIKKMAELKVIACVNTYWHIKDPSVYYESEEVFLGEERAENEYPLRSFLDSGVMIVCSADYPSSPYPNPFFAIQAAVTRNMYDADYFGVKKITNEDDSQWLLDPSERISVSDIIKAYTINAAYALHMEDEIGSLEVGKKADAIVIDKDVFFENHLDIENIKVIKTFFGGEEVYSAL